MGWLRRCDRSSGSLCWSRRWATRSWDAAVHRGWLRAIESLRPVVPGSSAPVDRRRSTRADGVGRDGGPGDDRASAAAFVRGDRLPIRSAPISVVLPALSTVGCHRASRPGEMVAAGADGGRGVRSDRVPVVGRTRCRMVSRPPHPVADAGTPHLRGLHRLLRHLWRGPFRLRPAAAASTARSPVRGAVPCRRPTSSRRSPSDKTAA
jgi:hypothetical protein